VVAGGGKRPNPGARGSPEADNRDVARKKRPRSTDDPLAVYRRIRKPMPPPEKTIADKRRKLEEEQARREVSEASDDVR
jgi:hypothetical protein